MFADTAMANDRSSPAGGQGTLIEYSFAEPPFTVHNGRPVTEFYMSPSVHFRHRNRANVGWADGHIEPRPIAEFDSANAYGVDSDGMQLGWFEPVDNSPYDLK
jgi:prepilin-type processing-associated H-X9-DG protein